MVYWIQPRKFKRGIGVSFYPCANAMERWPHWQLHMEVSYCAFGFGVIIRHDMHALSLPCDSLCLHDLVHTGKATHACLAGLATKIIQRYNNSAP